MVGVTAVVPDGFDDAVSAILLTREVQIPGGDSSSMLLVVIRTSAMLPSTLRRREGCEGKVSSSSNQSRVDLDGSCVRGHLMGVSPQGNQKRGPKSALVVPSGQGTGMHVAEP